jgi:hypothetical protein
MLRDNLDEKGGGDQSFEAAAGHMQARALQSSRRRG